MVGAGLVGQLVAHCAAAGRATTVLVDRSAERLEGARARGVLRLHVPDDAELVHTVEAAVGRGCITKVFLAISGDATQTLEACVRLLAAHALSDRRPAIIGVGRFTARTQFSVEMGNLDLRMSARCGAGYRDEEYVHGRRERRPIPPEHTVDDNLRRGIALITSGVIAPEAISTLRASFSDAPGAYSTLRASRHLTTALFQHRSER